MMATHFSRFTQRSQVVNRTKAALKLSGTCSLLHKHMNIHGENVLKRCCTTLPHFNRANSSRTFTSGQSPANDIGLDNRYQKGALLNHQPVRSAGHSHWQNIRHTKGAVDAQRQKDNNRIRQKIRLAIKIGGGTDPKLNRELGRAVEEGKACNVPMAAMTDTIKKITESKEEGSEVIFEAMNLLTKFFVMVECFTDRPGHVRNHLRGILKRTGGTMLEPGRAASMFEQKGVVYVVPTDEYTLDLDQATEQAIEAGAEEVLEGVDGNGNACLRFLCGPKELHQVKTALESLQVPVNDARLEFIPHIFVKIKQDQAEMAQKMIVSLEDFEDVVRVYDNVEIDELKS